MRIYNVISYVLFVIRSFLQHRPIHVVAADSSHVVFSHNSLRCRSIALALLMVMTMIARPEFEVRALAAFARPVCICLHRS